MREWRYEMRSLAAMKNAKLKIDQFYQ